MFCFAIEARKSSFLVCALFCFAVFDSPAKADLFTFGHGDIGVAYDAGALELHWHLGSNAVVNGAVLGGTGAEYAPNGITAVVGLNATFPGGRPAGSAWDFMGNSAGQTFYYLPQTGSEANALGVPFLGFGTEELVPAQWGQLTWTAKLLDGAPGHFSLFSGFTPNVLASSFTAAIETFTTAAGEHDHANFAFTAPGVYNVEFTVSATHVTDGMKTDRGVFQFNITAVPEPSSMLLVASFGAIVLVPFGSLRRRRWATKE